MTISCLLPAETTSDHSKTYFSLSEIILITIMTNLPIISSHLFISQTYLDIKLSDTSTVYLI